MENITKSGPQPSTQEEPGVQAQGTKIYPQQPQVAPTGNWGLGCLIRRLLGGLYRINYMCITAHFIDDQWKLNKRIISFVPVSSHMGEYIAKALESCLVEWGIRNVFTVTVDNASSNDTAMGFFKSKLLSWGTTSVRKVRDTVIWVRNSPARLKKFRDLADLIGVEAKSALQLDVPTRWNSTYLMLSTAIQYQKVFEAYEENDASFCADLADSVPSYLDWCSVQSWVTLLKCFYDMTVRISSSLYVTPNTFFNEISDLNCMLDDMIAAETSCEKAMGTQMKNKFVKYWGDPEKMNFLIFFANILDPRDKIEYMPYQFVQLYGEERGKACFQKVQAAMVDLYNEYAATYSVNMQSESAQPVEYVNMQPISQCQTLVGRPQSKLKNQLKRQRMESGGSSKQTELQVYLSENIMDDKEDFDVLRWWKLNSERLPILSKIARDVLAVPISTVASESAFSTSGRVLDPFRSSLTPKTVEALVCTQDCLKFIFAELASGVRTAGTSSSLPAIAVIVFISTFCPVL
ncbi:zinc finger BED domain-containing protein RICESLEEPER 2-like [Ipomoea triloba]|uniref:zinc finger BED domain-containing protein RICESLEEPER 2-like n=1 Tax=Ipomoea triloba TaxID=35885 RepID=UPI00125E0F56|nr:zinc finger BED domain-containing protein RICESLEEPER 2-like [Ipomoea triloba]